LLPYDCYKYASLILAQQTFRKVGGFKPNEAEDAAIATVDLNRTDGGNVGMEFSVGDGLSRVSKYNLISFELVSNVRLDAANRDICFKN
jgi:hypothetical protein